MNWTQFLKLENNFFFCCICSSYFKTLNLPLNTVMLHLTCHVPTHASESLDKADRPLSPLGTRKRDQCSLTTSYSKVLMRSRQLKLTSDLHCMQPASFVHELTSIVNLSYISLHVLYCVQQKATRPEWTVQCTLHFKLTILNLIKGQSSTGQMRWEQETYVTVTSAIDAGYIRFPKPSEVRANWIDQWPTLHWAWRSLFYLHALSLHLWCTNWPLCSIQYMYNKVLPVYNSRWQCCVVAL